MIKIYKPLNSNQEWSYAPSDVSTSHENATLFVSFNLGSATKYLPLSEEEILIDVLSLICHDSSSWVWNGVHGRLSWGWAEMGRIISFM